MELSNAFLIGAYAVIMLRTIALLIDCSIPRVFIVHTVPMFLTFTLVACGTLFGGALWMFITMALSLLIDRLFRLIYETVTSESDDEEEAN
jgi:hypothetical protein